MVKLRNDSGASILAVNCGSVNLGSQLRNCHFLPHTQIVRQEESENSIITFFYYKPFCCLQTSQLGDIVRNVGVEHPASTSQWSAPPGLTATARTALETAVARVPTAWLIPPQDGELFDRPDKAFARLQGYALGAGFAVVKGPTTPIRKIYQCIYHGGATR